jgi:predicted dehydrogenase/nucleoside-diphosphate-sugar epimerase
MIARPLRIAFVGAGRMAANHACALEHVDTPAVIVGVHDRARDRAGEFAARAGTTAFHSIDDMLAAAKPDVVHVCTPPAAHFEAAHAALDGGAHVYVEKPFASSVREAQTLVDLARSHGVLVNAGHQQLHDPAFTALMASAGRIGPLLQVDSHFAFRPVGLTPDKGSRFLSQQLVDVLPHPLYTLIAAMERLMRRPASFELAWAHAEPADVHAIVRAGSLIGRLSVSVRARPVASELTLIGTHGSLKCDFVRSTMLGAGNAGTEALEKILNPLTEGVQLLSRTAVSLARRLGSGTGYPGLAELIGAFYRAVAAGGESPVSPEHLLRVTNIFEALVTCIDRATHASPRPKPTVPRFNADHPVVLTGAGGFLGHAIARQLAPVRSVVRSASSMNASLEAPVVADLGDGLPTSALADARVVVHAAAETAGGFEAHERNSIDATRQLLHAMSVAGVSRLVLVSSLSVIRPPLTPWECQNEHTPRPADPRRLGPYTWGKSLQEELVEREASQLGIATRIVRPGALIDLRDPALPGLMGRRLVGDWHLGLGRPGLPIAVCDVEQCAQVIAWCATHFDEAPPIVNLFDPSVSTRRLLIQRLRMQGWQGRMVWVPISVIAAAFASVRTALAIAGGRLPERLAVWSILRPRRYDPRLATKLLDAVAQHNDAEAENPPRQLYRPAPARVIASAQALR